MGVLTSQPVRIVVLLITQFDSTAAHASTRTLHPGIADTSKMVNPLHG
jgi:hypothetical protein